MPAIPRGPTLPPPWLPYDKNKRYGPKPTKKECEEERRKAEAFCLKELRAGRLKKGYDGFGEDIEKCIQGQLSEDCGGNLVA
jgi:hypothetical protein